MDFIIYYVIHEKDIRDLSKVIDIVSFAKLLRIIGLRTGNLLNNKNLSIAIGLDQRTVARYIELLKSHSNQFIKTMVIKFRQTLCKNTKDIY